MSVDISECRPTIDRYIDRESVDSRSIAGRHSGDGRSIHWSRCASADIVFSSPIPRRYFTDTSLSIARLLVERKDSDILVDISVDSRPIVDHVTVAKFVAASLVCELTHTKKLIRYVNLPPTDNRPASDRVRATLNRHLGESSPICHRHLTDIPPKFYRYSIEMRLRNIDR